MIRNGHLGAWDYTPREIFGWLHFAEKERKSGMASDLVVAATSRGEAKSIKKAIKSWTED